MLAILDFRAAPRSVVASVEGFPIPDPEAL